MTGPSCWKPRCTRPAPTVLAGDGWTIHTCTGVHEATARYVLARPVKVPRQRGAAGQLALDLETAES